VTCPRIPLTPLSHEGIECVSACLKADGHGPLSSLMYEWVWEADKARRREISAAVEGAVWTTLHLWA
jgi:hypothetical protein